MARQHGFGGYEGLDSLHKGNGAPLHSHSFGDTSPTPSRFRSHTITIQSLERVAAMQCDLEDRERKYRKTGRWYFVGPQKCMLASLCHAGYVWCPSQTLNLHFHGFALHFTESSQNPHGAVLLLSRVLQRIRRRPRGGAL